MEGRADGGPPTLMQRNKRIGCIVPAINVTVEDDFRALCPPNVGIHFARADVDQKRPLDAQLQQMVEAAPKLARTLAKATVGVVAFACTSASLSKGAEADRALATAMQRESGVPSVTTATALVQALSALGARRIGLATPYMAWVLEREKTFLAEHGFEVTAAIGLDRRGGFDIHGIDAATIRDLVAEVDSIRVDTLLVSCTDLPVLKLIRELEAHHCKPVVTSNQATFWACARISGVGPIAGYGQLLDGRATQQRSDYNA